MIEWASGRVVNMMDITGGFLGNAGVGEVHVLNIFIGHNFEDLLNNFLHFGRFWKEQKQGKRLCYVDVFQGFQWVGEQCLFLWLKS